MTDLTKGKDKSFPMAESESTTSRQSALEAIEQLTIQLQAVRALADDPRKYYGTSPQRSLLRKHREQLGLERAQ